MLSTKSKWDSSSDEESTDRQYIRKRNDTAKDRDESVRLDIVRDTASPNWKKQRLDVDQVESPANPCITSATSGSKNDVDRDDFGSDTASPVAEIAPPTEAKESASEKASTRIHPRAHNPIFDGCRSVNNYEQVNFIDQGTYGMVFKARCRETGELYALKQIKFGAETSKIGFPISALREINILLALQHPNIVLVKEMVVGSSIDKIYMVMEYCENDLKTCMKLSRQSFSTAEVKQLMKQLLSAVAHMHHHWYIHRDLKTSNLLYSNNGTLRVCDFGMARKYGSPIAPYTHEVVTLWYRAPEVLLGSRTYSTPLDMWSVGCIFGEMLTGEPMFPGEGEPDQIMKIFRVLGAPNDQKWPGFSSLPNSSKISWRVPSRSKLRDLFPVASFSGGVSLSDKGLDLLDRLLYMNPAERTTAAEAMEHEWLVKELPKPMPIESMPKFQSRDDVDDKVD